MLRALATCRVQKALWTFVRYSSRKPKILAVTTVDTKGWELAYVAAQVQRAGAHCELADVSARAPSQDQVASAGVTISREVIAACHPEGASSVLDISDRGEAVTAMSVALSNYVIREVSKFDGILGLGGSGGTALITPAMQALPLGFPKVMVTTMASGDVSPYVGSSDVTIMPSVVDVAGLNAISRVVLSNAAAAVSGMALNKPPAVGNAKPAIALTQFGVTTPLCEVVRGELEREFDVITFHATGSGGRAMEKLMLSNVFAGVLDLTTTEVADEVVGGVLSAGPERLDALATSQIPAVISVGALDMVNFGGVAAIPQQFSERKLHEHNTHVTLMRTTMEELRTIAQFITGKLNKARGPLTLLLPEHGISAIDKSGMPFDDPVAREALFTELEAGLVPAPHRRVRRIEAHINDEAFAVAAAQAFRDMIAEAPPVEGSAATSAGMPATTKAPVVLPPTAAGPREEVLKRLNEVVASGKPIIGAGAGTGISAKFEEAGGADLIIVYNSGRFRMGGHGSLAGLMPFKDANAIMLEMGEEILPVLKQVPLLAGICATDPFRQMDKLLLKVKEMGFAGIQNFPTVGLIDGVFRQNLEETGMSYQREVEVVKLARGLGLLTTPYCFNPHEARLMAEAGADVVVAHMGLTTRGSIGASTALTLDEAVRRVQEIADAALEINPEVLIMAHGGPIAMPEDAEYVLTHTRGVHGFYGASSMERLPVEVAITEQIRKFKDISMTPVGDS